MSEHTGSRTLPRTELYKPPHLSRQERKRLAKERGRKFMPLAGEAKDGTAQQIIGCRQRITATELEVLRNDVTKMDVPEMMPIVDATDGK